MQFVELHIFGTALLAGVGTVLVMRGARAHKRMTAEFPDVFQWKHRSAGVVTWALLVLVPLALPYLFESTRIENYFDLVIAMLITAGCGLGVVEGINRRVAMSETSVGGVTWAGNLKQIAWRDITDISFSDFFGGFFTCRSSTANIFLPVPIDRPLRAIALMESRAPVAALSKAKKGIALCRAALEP
jgi:hypothetical protein